ncbi:MAG: hypothetical protein OXI63_20785 [Candidatus Poribacteria bacterium]|nr:hypothetical protein [Candidatus Poribacteria bacterium]
MLKLHTSAGSIRLQKAEKAENQVLLSIKSNTDAIAVEEPILEKIEKTYGVKSGGNLSVLSEFGAIEIQTAEQENVEVVITKESKSKSVEAVEKMLADFELAFEQKGADVHIRGTFKHDREHWWKQFNLAKIHFLITVPQQYNVDLNTLSSDISVANLTGDVRVKTSGGSLRFQSITGPVLGHTSGGSIEAVNVTGGVQVRTSGGSIRFGAIRGFISGRTSGGSIKAVDCNQGIDVRTSGGSIWLGGIGRNVTARTSGGSIQTVMKTQPQSECSLRTSGGAITCTLMPDVAVEVEAKASGGRVSTDFAVESTIQGKVPKNRLEGSINGGGPLLKLRTSGGNIHLQKASN